MDRGWHHRYRQRYLIERMFCRLKEFRRIATRYDRPAHNFFSAALIADIVIQWIDRVWTQGTGDTGNVR